MVVQELPARKRPAYERLRGKPCKTHAEHNNIHTKSVEDLSRAFTDVSTFSYGGLSHCTLLLGLLRIKHGAVWKIPEAHQEQGLEAFQTGPGGCWDLPKMRRVPRFRELLEVIDNGVLCEVLSWQIHLDPECADGPAVISAALNDPQGKGVSSHEMEMFKSLCDEVTTAAAAAASTTGAVVDYDAILITELLASLAAPRTD